MSQNIEIEFKNLLLKEEFNQLLTYFQLSKADFFRQENHYFDTKDFTLKQLGSALRIRKKPDHFEMTLKQPHPDGLLETNEKLTEVDALAYLSGEPLKQGSIYLSLVSEGINPQELCYFGTLTTDRAEIEYKDGLLVLDRSSYLNVIDFEVEYEVNNRADGEIIFKKLLDELQIPVRKTKNKVKRFYDRKKMMEA